MLILIPSVPSFSFNKFVFLNCRHFNYIFYVDFEASTAEVRVQNALNDLKVNGLLSLDIVE